MNSMELTQLKYFIEVADSQHVTASAEKLHIAQTALSMTIHRLEDDLGEKLFEKKGRNIVLTPCGRYFYDQVVPLVRRLEAIPSELKLISDVSGKTVRINVLAASAILTEAIIRFRENNPDCIFHLTQNESDEPCDIEVATSLFYQTANGRQDVFISREEIYIAVPNDSIYEGKQSVKLKDLENENFISLSGSRQFRAICDKLCRSSGIHPNVIFESDSPATVQNMIKANIGIGFWPEKSWGDYDREKIRLLHVEEPVCFRNIIVAIKTARPNAAALAFFTYLKEYFK